MDYHKGYIYYIVSLKVPENSIKSMILRWDMVLTAPLLHHFLKDPLNDKHKIKRDCGKQSFLIPPSKKDRTRDYEDKKMKMIRREGPCRIMKIKQNVA